MFCVSEHINTVFLIIHNSIKIGGVNKETVNLLIRGFRGRAPVRIKKSMIK